MKRQGTSGLWGAVALIVVAVLAAIAPVPPPLVERYFSRGIYPPVQRALTTFSNVFPVSLLDVLVGTVIVAFLLMFISGARARGWKPSLQRAGVSLLKVIAVWYLAFLVLWGMNYRRVPLEQKLDFEPSRVSQARAVALATEAVHRVNTLHAAAHLTTFDSGKLARAFASAEGALGGARATMVGRPKWSVLGVYFQKAAISGMTDPIFLEVMLNPDLLTVEQPEVLAHEWAHLAGYAAESEANFLAWLTCLRGDALAQYSGWLSAYARATNVLPKRVRASLPPLNAGPRRDLQAMAARYHRSSPIVRKAAREVYDSYLKANRIEEGIENYDVVLQLMLGTSLGSDWK